MDVGKKEERNVDVEKKGKKEERNVDVEKKGEKEECISSAHLN
jgi:hypothetical protein